MSTDAAFPADDVLVDRLRGGDEAAFALILDAWSGSMMRLAQSFVSTPASAEEVVQDTWIAVIRGLAGFEGRSALKTWVFRILVNTAKRRGMKENRTVPFGSLLSEDSGPLVDRTRFQPDGYPHPGHWRVGEEPQRRSGPEDEAERVEMREVIVAAMAELSDRSQIVLTLRDAEGYTSAEVCALLGITAGNQRVILHRARSAVRARLENYCSPGRSRDAEWATHTAKAPIRR
ncbi:RNA polymerase sigma factor [Nocardia mexicana]|uniref:RNA polymerase sigma-70 factor (ECF subfamily) n=1 Tax=Nocardia mexicana TaxID=279262 RepID=A0A370GMI8_9NOCA|nr:sigma-70 family RNA polymerase sigma factor [Nocardia mexicana]RDI43634.1 RNA polymerase sigma-70 factor (ECF subfamily) [Nocardia mexicana]